MKLVEKSGSAALKIPKKKAVVKKKKKNKINFTSLQKKKAKIVSIPVKSSKLSVSSRMSSSSSNLCPSLSSSSSLPLIVMDVNVDEMTGIVEEADLNQSLEEIIAIHGNAESVTAINHELCVRSELTSEEQVIKNGAIDCVIRESEQGLNDLEENRKEEVVGRTEVQRTSISIIKSTEGIDTTEREKDSSEGQRSQNISNIDGLVPEVEVEVAVEVDTEAEGRNGIDIIHKDIVMEEMKSATAVSTIKKNILNNFFHYFHYFLFFASCITQTFPLYFLRWWLLRMIVENILLDD